MRINRSKLEILETADKDMIKEFFNSPDYKEHIEEIYIYLLELGKYPKVKSILESMC